ncbi:hypothetical protein PR048_003467 [Dryococelus australis]|uniref:Vacuolar protein sorting-associated protein 16 homolog n=1 Tax=Dryococelus australis TaxID=614101 RepID=A0ABQ9IN58_9NEOP|nr:hypothetical protein PR048_003467 [Dryococelus australis]
MSWQNEINLDSVVVSAASYGGPVAVVRDRKKFVKIQGSSKPVISVYTSSGKQLSSVVWSSGQIVSLGWSSEEELLCVQNDGHVLVYDMFGTYRHTFGMGQEAKDTNVIEAKIFTSAHGTGVVVLTSSYRFFLVNNVSDPKVRQLAEVAGLTVPPSSWTVVSEDRHTHVLMARDKELYLLKHSEQHAFPLSLDLDRARSIVEMAVSHNNSHVALFTDLGNLWIGSADLRKKYCEFDTKCPNRPHQLVWCGTEAVIGYWDSVLLVVGRQGDFISYSYDYPVHLVPEMDGVRILSATSHDMIQKVPLVVQQIFRINSTEPGSYLLEASKQFQRRNHRADEYVRLVKDQLDEAVGQCIKAAGYEFDPENQKMLMKAAQFGKCFIPDVDSEPYVKMCRTLRVLNAVHSFGTGRLQTLCQEHHMSFQVLLDRLVIRRHFYLAIQVAKYLRLPDVEGSSRILAHWACYKVNQSHLDMEQVAKDIADKLGYAAGVSYSEIAKKAADCGRTQLAIKLIDYEPRASLQVPLLLKLGEDRPALVKAIDSGNTDLVYMVLLHLRDNMPMAEFQMMIRNYPIALSLYAKYCREHNRETLRDIYDLEDNYTSQAAFHLQECYDPKNSSMKAASLEAAKQGYKRARNDFAATLCEEQQKLLKYQATLEEKFRREFVGLSLHDTVHMLLMLNEVKLADKLRTEYRVPDRRYWWLRVLTLSKLGDWVDLDKFSKTKKSPIGYEPFVDMCLKHGNRYEAQKYLPRVKDDLKVKILFQENNYTLCIRFIFPLYNIEQVRLHLASVVSISTLLLGRR